MYSTMLTFNAMVMGSGGLKTQVKNRVRNDYEPENIQQKTTSEFLEKIYRRILDGGTCTNIRAMRQEHELYM